MTPYAYPKKSQTTGRHPHSNLQKWRSEFMNEFNTSSVTSKPPGFQIVQNFIDLHHRQFVQYGIDKNSISLVSRVEPCLRCNTQQCLCLVKTTFHPKRDGNQNIPARFSLILKDFIHIITLLGVVHNISNFHMLFLN